MNKDIAKKWYQQALHDLDIAEKNLDIEGYDIAAFLAHQSIEKLFKGILILEGKQAPKTHNLERLAELLNLPSSISDAVLDFIEDYILSRYPDASIDLPYLQYDLEVSKSKVGNAKIIFEELKERYKELVE
jgi:HEPN domain-containing protein